MKIHRSGLKAKIFIREVKEGGDNNYALMMAVKKFSIKKVIHKETVVLKTWDQKLHKPGLVETLVA